MWDDIFNLIYSWGNRYLFEVALTLVFFLLLHFVGYPFIIRRHNVRAQRPAPAITTGNITTTGDNSPIYVGTEPARTGAAKNVQPHK